MARGFSDDEEDDMIAIEGRLLDTTPKSYKFQGDFWPEPQFVPMSQSRWEPEPDSDERHGKLYIKKWLVKKNSWNE